jgi:hypothetical protein
MGARKIVGIVLIVLGALALGVFLLADIIGYGNPGFGLRQIIGSIAGAVAVVVGLVLLLIKK